MLRSAGLRRQLDAMRTALDPSSTLPSDSVDDAVERLSRALDRHLHSHAASDVVGGRLVDALDVIPQGIVLADGDGQVVFRNRVAGQFLTARHGEALVESAIREMVLSA